METADQRFKSRYPFWWDDLSDLEATVTCTRKRDGSQYTRHVTMGPCHRLLVVSVMRHAYWEGERYLLAWGSKRSADEAGVGHNVATETKQLLRNAGLITLVRAGSKITQEPDLYDVTRLAQLKRPS